MATFNININQLKQDQYIVKSSHLINLTNCSTINEEYALGIVEQTLNSSLMYLLQSYSGQNPWKSFKIRNISSTKPLNIYLENGGVQIPEQGSTVYTVDIENILASVAIPDFVFKIDSLNLTQNESITFELAVEDSTGFVGSYTQVIIFIQKNNCIELEEINCEFSNVQVDSCSTTATLTINVPSEESRRVVIFPQDLYGSPSVDETITTTTQYNIQITGDSSQTPIDSSIIVQVYLAPPSTTLIDSCIISRSHNGNNC